MRLIDADELINQGYEIVVDGWQYDTCNKSIDIDNIPTAYSVDKVVTELNELDVKAIKRYKGGTFGDYEGTDYYIEKSKAIEIVKQGCVSDDVCEWKYINDFELASDNHESKCIERCNYIYCPYCGKKIKVVE